MGRVGAIVLALTAAGCSDLQAAQRGKFNANRVEEARSRYEAATDNVGRCVSAKLVAVAYADLGAATDAKVWRAREAADCQAAYADLGPVTDLDVAE